MLTKFLFDLTALLFVRWAPNISISLCFKEMIETTLTVFLAYFHLKNALAILKPKRTKTCGSDL